MAAPVAGGPWAAALAPTLNLTSSLPPGPPPMGTPSTTNAQEGVALQHWTDQVVVQRAGEVDLTPCHPVLRAAQRCPPWADAWAVPSALPRKAPKGPLSPQHIVPSQLRA